MNAIEDMDPTLLHAQWSQHLLEISSACAPLATTLIDTIPEVNIHPQHYELHVLASTRPREAVVMMIDSHVVQRNLWKNFLVGLDKAGLSHVREKFFSPDVIRCTCVSPLGIA